MKRLLLLTVTLVALGCQRPNESTSRGGATETNAVIERPRRNDATFKPRWPQKVAGEWVSSSDSRLDGLRLSQVEFAPMQPLPEWGYVPIESTAPTIRSTVFNETQLEVANIRLKVQAVRKSDGVVLAAEVTDIPGKFRTTLPGSIETRIFVLRHDGAFLEHKKWAPYLIKTSVDGVRVWNSEASARSTSEPSESR